MLSNLSWKEYAEFIGALTAAYYVIIVLIYYRKDIIRLSAARKNTAKPEQIEVSADPVTEAANPYYAPSLDELEQVVSAIKTNILERAGISAGKAALLTELKAYLANYDGLRQPAYRDAINQYIAEQAKELCGVTFSVGELEEEWKKLPR